MIGEEFDLATATASPPSGGVGTLRRIAAEAAGVDIDGRAPEGHEPGAGRREIALAGGRRRYMVRHIAGREDVEFLRTAIEAGFNVCLYGPPGTGKTTLVEAALGEGRVITQEFSEGTQVEDITGSFFPAPERGWEWGDGSLVRALRTGSVWFGDDITQGDPRVQSRVFPALDSRRRVTLNERGGEVVEAAEGFGAVIAYNPNLPGTTFSEALASRCAVHVHVGFDAATARAVGVPRDAVTAAATLNSRLEAEDPIAGLAPAEAGPVGWAPQLRELLAFKAVAEVFDELTAARNLLGLCPPESRGAMAEALEAHVTDGISVDPLRVE
jgi:nitric oxide reductase NorQ protein